ncbi:MAG: type I-E CRISPR-associated protein Cas5/CasD [Clostridiaceae bacterium]|nr:type I-E CRISPR-associated protein Cas5/CasD [Clostridiaceae bacterium]
MTGYPLRNAEDNPRSTGNTIVTYRQYLQDDSFLVALQAEEETIRMLEQALRHPVRCMYLGRKSCVPSRPVLEASTNAYAD